jgi:hypothetical protein
MLFPVRISGSIRDYGSLFLSDRLVNALVERKLEKAFADSAA